MPEELTPYNTRPDLTKVLEKEAGRIEEDTLHSAKGHFNAASGWSKIHYILGLPAAVLAAWAGFNAFSDNSEFTAILAIASATLGAINTFLNPNQKTAEHKNAGREFNGLKNRARFFREIQLPSSSAQEAKEIL